MRRLSKTIHIVIFISNSPKGCSKHIKNVLGATAATVLCSYWLIIGEVDYYFMSVAYIQYYTYLQIHMDFPNVPDFWVVYIYYRPHFRIFINLCIYIFLSLFIYRICRDIKIPMFLWFLKCVMLFFLSWAKNMMG